MRTGSPETAAYLLVHGAVLVRVFGPLLVPEHYSAMLIMAGSAWSLAFCIYLVIYWPMLAWVRK